MWAWLWACAWSLLLYRLLKAVFYLAKPFYFYVFARRLGRLPALREYEDQWTILTGCTDGIGRAYLLELAQRGLRRFVLISRSQSKLDSLAQFLDKEFGAECKVLAFDFDTSDYAPLEGFVRSLDDIGILVNNVGIGPGKRANLAQRPYGEAARIMRVNTMSAVTMIDLVVRGMAQRQKGIVVTIGSITGWRYFPHFSTYPASKTCIAFLSESLRDEFAGSGVRFQVLMAGLVETKLSNVASDGYFTVSPQVFAKQAVDILGASIMTMGCISHDIMGGFMMLIPFWIIKLFLNPISKLQDRLSKTR